MHNRRSIRLRQYNYAQPGTYFITIVAQERECLFGDITDGQMQLNEYGRVVMECWGAIPDHFPNVALDAFVVMPNHVHGIIIISNPVVGATHASPLQSHASPLQSHASPLQSPGPSRKSVGAIVGSFKSAVAKYINRFRNSPDVPVWQRNYYERIIRDEEELNQIREYIAHNPSQWDNDSEYTAS